MPSSLVNKPNRIVLSFWDMVTHFVFESREWGREAFLLLRAITKAVYCKRQVFVLRKITGFIWNAWNMEHIA